MSEGNSSLITFLQLVFFYFTRTMKIITGRRRWFLTEVSPRLTTMDDNDTLTVFAGYYARSLFSLSAFLNGVAGIHPGLINLNKIKTRVLEFFLACIYIERDSLCYNNFVSLQQLSCRHTLISNSKLTDPSAFSGSPHSKEMTDDRSLSRVEFRVRVFRVGNCFLKL